ncbi:MAG: glycoside hydrolase [Paludibacteraceae bacterium]|nr:glycoside hydrolase [Paludibacteraceae bacterium]
MKQFILLFASIIALTACAKSNSQSNQPEEEYDYPTPVAGPTSTVFTTGNIPYRIPAIATCPDGTLIAVADYRSSRQDIGAGKIDLHIRTSSDNGQTWGEIIAPECMSGDGVMTPGNQKAGYGDPCIVADRESGKVMVMSCSGFPKFFDGSRSQHQGMSRWYSTDEGQTWSDPVYLDEEFIYSKFDASSYGPIRGWFVGSGKIHQSRYTKVGDYYRLYCAGSSYNGSETANWVIYSDDFGESWKFLGGCDKSPVAKGDEPKVDELPNGNIVISSRNEKGRYFNIFSFTDAGAAQGVWESKYLSSRASNGVTCDNACNGEFGIYPVVRKADNKKMWLALQSLPKGPDRTNVAIFYKALESEEDYDTPQHFASDWDGFFQVSTISSAYSSWSICKDSSLGFVYEENGRDGGYDIVYKNLSIQWITNGDYYPAK